MPKHEIKGPLVVQILTNVRAQVGNLPDVDTRDQDVVDAMALKYLCHALSLLYFEKAPMPITSETFSPYLAAVFRVMTADFAALKEISAALHDDPSVVADAKKAADDLLERIMKK